MNKNKRKADMYEIFNKMGESLRNRKTNSIELLKKEPWKKIGTVTFRSLKSKDRDINTMDKANIKNLDKLSKIQDEWIDLDMTNELVKLTDKINEIIEYINNHHA
jgi:hypothetical protein